MVLRKPIVCVLLVAACAACGEGGVPLPDAGLAVDAGLSSDAGVFVDAGIPDAGALLDAGAPPDAGPPPDAGVTTFEPAAVQQNDTRFPLGVQSGDATPVSVILWTRYAGNQSLVLKLLADGAAPPYRVLRELPVADNGGYVHIDLGGLAPMTRYRFVFVESSAGGGRSAIGRFVTAPFPGDAAKLRFGATSCTKQSHRPFTPLTQASRQELDFFMLLGDTSYNDDAHTQSEYRAAWAQNLSSRGYLDVLTSTSHIATWDDHEVVDNWEGETVDRARLAIAQDAFWETLAIRRQPEPNRNRLWRKLQWGKAADVFVLDCRSERLLSTRSGPNAQYISPAQMSWLKDGLRNSTAAFKLIVNSVPLANFPLLFDVLANDRWEGYQAQRMDLLNYIHDNQIKGVVFISGDFHIAAVARLEASEPFFNYYDILVGPGGNTANPALLTLSGAQFELATGTNNSVIFDIDPTVTPATMRFRFLDGNGGVFFDKTINPGP